jgi:hypothetical protein
VKTQTKSLLNGEKATEAAGETEQRIAAFQVPWRRRAMMNLNHRSSAGDDMARVKRRSDGRESDVGEVLFTGVMAPEKSPVKRTAEIPTRKISLLKLAATREETTKGGVAGWECAPPRIGRPYAIWLYEGMVLRTSPVRDIRKTKCALIIKTLNSLYRLEYLKENQRT